MFLWKIPEATLAEPRKPPGGRLDPGEHIVHRAAERGNVAALWDFLCADPELVNEEDDIGRWPQRMAELLVSGWCCRREVPEEDPRF